MRIETADVSDAGAILELQKLCYQSEAALFNDYRIPPLTQTLEELRLEFGSRVFLKAVASDSIIGSVRAFIREGTCHIGRLIVHPGHQNRGIGTRLMASIESRFPQAERFELFTGEKSVKNLHLYGRLGYRELRKEPLTPLVTIVYLEKTGVEKGRQGGPR